MLGSGALEIIYSTPVSCIGLAFDIIHRMGFGELSDDELLKRYQRTKNQKWISQLFGRYVELIYGVCLRYSPDVREAEDYTMDIYEKVVQKALTHNIKQFKSWIYIVSKNYCLERIRKLTGMRTDTFDPNFMQLQSELHPIDEPADMERKEQHLIWMEDCLKTLNALQKTSIELFYYKNKTYVEIASLIEDEVSQVRSYLQNGRRNMKKCVEAKSKDGR